MDTLRLLLTDTTLLLSQKGKPLLEKTFSDDNECFSILSTELAKYKKTKIECLFSGSRLVSESIYITYAHPESFIAEEKTLKLLLDSSTQSFIDRNKEAKLDIVQTEVTSITLNGYRVATLSKQKVNEIKASLFLSGVSVAYKKQLLDCFGYSGTSATFSSFAWYLAGRVARLSKKDEFMICSVYENSTDIFLRKSDGYFKMVTISCGSHNPPTTMSEEIKKGLTTLCEGTLLPFNVFLLASPQVEKLFIEAFSSDSYHSLLFSEKGFDVTIMSSILES